MPLGLKTAQHLKLKVSGRSGYAREDWRFLVHAKSAYDSNLNLQECWSTSIWTASTCLFPLPRRRDLSPKNSRPPQPAAPMFNLRAFGQDTKNMQSMLLSSHTLLRCDVRASSVTKSRRPSARKRRSNPIRPLANLTHLAIFHNRPTNGANYIQAAPHSPTSALFMTGYP